MFAKIFKDFEAGIFAKSSIQICLMGPLIHIWYPFFGLNFLWNFYFKCIHFFFIRTKKIDLKLSFQRRTSLKIFLFYSYLIYSVFTIPHTLLNFETFEIFSDNCNYCGVGEKKLNINEMKLWYTFTRKILIVIGKWFLVHYLLYYIIDTQNRIYITWLNLRLNLFLSAIIFWKISASIFL